MVLNITHLPTSQDALEAQINDEFTKSEERAGGPSPEPEAKPNVDYIEPEYFPPNTEREEKYAEILKDVVNPHLVELGTSPLNDEDIEKGAGLASDVVSNVNEVIKAKVPAPKFLQEMHPVTASVLALGGFVAVKAAGRVFELYMKNRLVNVTPQTAPNSAPENAAESASEAAPESNPIYG